MTSTAATGRVATPRQTSVRLVVLPTLVGLAAIALGAGGLLASGVIGSGGGRNPAFLIGVFAFMLAASVMTGNVVGLYLALGLVGGLGLAADGPLSLRGGVVLVATIVAVHELTRFSLDARKPTRLGPGLAAGFAVRSLAVLALAVAFVPVGRALLRSTLDPWLVPVGLAASAIPLFAVRLFDPRPATTARTIDRPIVRAALGLALATAALTTVLLAAQARTAIETTATPTDQTDTTTTTGPLEETDSVVILPPAGNGGAGNGRDVTLLAIGLLVVVIGVVMFVVRRSEADYELDELDIDHDDRTLGLARPGRADLDEQLVALSDAELDRLLDGLALDIESERDPGRAVRFGYANVERRLADIGVDRGETETEREFLSRALARLGRDGQPMVELTRLFERARFGHEPVDEAARQRALAAVEALRATAVEANAEDPR